MHRVITHRTSRRPHCMLKVFFTVGIVSSYVKSTCIPPWGSNRLARMSFRAAGGFAHSLDVLAADHKRR